MYTIIFVTQKMYVIKSESLKLKLAATFRILIRLLNLNYFNYLAITSNYLVHKNIGRRRGHNNYNIYK